jgi:hypothetical protein
MSEEFSVPVSLPLDSDGFLRRECPACELQFKWYAHQEGDTDAEQVHQYFCPRCGRPAGPDSWWTPAQLAHAQSAAGPTLDQYVQDALKDSFSGIKGITFQPSNDFTLGIPPPDPLVEPDDMVIAEPPCHPNEPVKVPDEATSCVHCLVCGTPFAV